MESFRQRQDKERKYGTHFHIVVREPGDGTVEQMLSELQRLYTTNYLSYYRVGDETVQGKRHIHVAVGCDRCQRKSTVVSKLKLFSMRRSYGWKSYYISPVYQNSTPKQNWDYVGKGGNILGEAGSPPEATRAGSAREKRADRDAHCIELAKLQQFETIERLYPGHWVRNGARLKGLYMRQVVPEDQGLEHNEHLWIYGPPGLGKTSLVEYLYPGHYKKRCDTDWLGWDASHEPHKVVLINDLDPSGMSILTPQLLKELCDPQGFNANKKYAGGEVINPSLVVVTSNFRIGECFKPGYYGLHQQSSALQRRFREVHIRELLTELGLVLTPVDEVEACKENGLWDEYGYKCMFKPVGKEDDVTFDWLTQPETGNEEHEREIEEEKKSD